MKPTENYLRVNSNEYSSQSPEYRLYSMYSHTYMYRRANLQMPDKLPSWFSD